MEVIPNMGSTAHTREYKETVSEVKDGIGGSFLV